MKIILLSPLPPPAGGIASWTERFIKDKEVLKHELSIINTSVNGKRINQLNKKNYFDESIRTIRIFNELRKKLVYSEKGIVHINTPCGNLGIIRDYICGKISKKFGYKLVTHCRCDVTFMLRSKVSKFFFKKLIKLSDKVITLNTVSKSYVNKECGKETIIIPNFISVDKDLVQHLKIRKEAKKILFVGHVTKQKGCEEIFKVANYFPDLKFKLVGYVSDEIKALKKPKNVLLLGEKNKEEVLKIMGNEDIFLFPTYTEGFPNVVTEAMKSGLPIISTSVGAIPDMLESHGAIFIQVGNVDDMKNAIITLKDDYKNRERMSLWNQKKVLEEYTQEKVIKKIINLYEELFNYKT